MSADLGSFLAIGLAGFFAGVAYGGREQLRVLRECASSSAMIVDGKSYLLTRLVPAPGGTTTIEISVPKKPVGELVALDGGKSGDAA